ncbi:MAG: sodium:solute symporter family protein [Synergistaceae bacterium]|nr:sodium:solute symporter family protein [Synergistaceae bacterium]
MLTWVDNIVIVMAVAGVLAVGYYFSKSVTDMESYYLANRSLPWSLVVGTLMASWYGGVGVIGTIGYASVFGLASWFLWSIGAHAVRFPLALWVGPKVHVRTDVTIPDVIQNTYGKFAAVIASIFLFVYCSQIGEITATGFVGEAAWGINKVVVGVIVVIITIALTCLGGLMGVAVTDMIFFLFMVVSVCLVFPQIFHSVGGLEGIRAATADNPAFMHPVAGMAPTKAIMLVILCINVYADPTFYQRFSASNSAKTGRRAMLTCFCLWMGFDIVTMVAGIIVHVARPDAQPELAYIQMILEYLPVGIRALFIIGLFGAIISTLDSYYLIGGTTLAKDLYARVFAENSISDKRLINLSRIGSCILGGIGVVFAYRFKLVYDALAFMSSLWMSTVFVAVLGALMYKGKKTPAGGVLSMLVGCLSFAYLQYYPITISESVGILEPLLVALPLSLIAYVIGNKIGSDINADNMKIQG